MGTQIEAQASHQTPHAPTTPTKRNTKRQHERLESEQRPEVPLRWEEDGDQVGRPAEEVRLQLRQQEDRPAKEEQRLHPQLRQQEDRPAKEDRRRAPRRPSA